jgi:hypothetical protein
VPKRIYYAQMLNKMQKIGRLGLFKSHRDQPDSEVTLDGILDQLVLAGTPQRVAEQVLALPEQIGDFGELVYAGMDWGGSGAGQAAPGADGDRGDAAGQRGATRARDQPQACRSLATRSGCEGSGQGVRALPQGQAT